LTAEQRLGGQRVAALEWQMEPTVVWGQAVF
jgi:hypothetical protein